MALRLYKEPEAARSLPAVRIGILLASAAWNASLGDDGLRDQHRVLLEKLDWGGRSPWPELLSTDTDCLIAGLIEYKKARYPEDRRLIVATETKAGGNVRVHWVEGNQPLPAPARAASSTPIGDGLVARVKREACCKIVDLRAVIAGRAAAKELHRKVVTREDLAGLHPAHAVYVCAQNQVAVMSEALTALEDMAPFTDMISRAEDLYMPGGPPMSPLTTSFFTCWALFDACAGPAEETIGTTVLKVGAAFGMHAESLRIIRLMQESRMGFYVHEGCGILRDLVTGAACHAIVPSGYRGQKGELWYARVLPSPIPGCSEHVVFTTPYIVLEPPIRDWQAYISRVQRDAPEAARIEASERHMKFGPTRSYWNDFVLEGYVNHTTDAIYLAGLPGLDLLVSKRLRTASFFAHNM